MDGAKKREELRSGGGAQVKNLTTILNQSACERAYTVRYRGVTGKKEKKSPLDPATVRPHRQDGQKKQMIITIPRLPGHISRRLALSSAPTAAVLKPYARDKLCFPLQLQFTSL